MLLNRLLYCRIFAREEKQLFCSQCLPTGLGSGRRMLCVNPAQPGKFERAADTGILNILKSMPECICYMLICDT